MKQKVGICETKQTNPGKVISFGPFSGTVSSLDYVYLIAPTNKAFVHLEFIIKGNKIVYEYHAYEVETSVPVIEVIPRIYTIKWMMNVDNAKLALDCRRRRP